MSDSPIIITRALSIATNGYLDGPLTIATDGILVELQVQPEPQPQPQPQPQSTPSVINIRPAIGSGTGAILYPRLPDPTWEYEVEETTLPPNFERVAAAAIGVALQTNSKEARAAASIALALEEDDGE